MQGNKGKNIKKWEKTIQDRNDQLIRNRNNKERSRSLGIKNFNHEISIIDIFDNRVEQTKESLNSQTDLLS